MNWIAKMRPGFYRKFASDIRSGDHLRIRRALRQGTKLMVRAAALEFELDVDQAITLRDTRRRMMPNHPLDDWASHVYLSYQYYEQTAVYAYHEQVVDIWMFLTQAIDLQRGGSRLGEELLVDLIAEKLAV